MNKQVQEACIDVATRTPMDKVPLATLRNAHPDDLARLGFSWNGGKVVGLPRGERMPVGISASDMVVEGRR